MLLLSLVLHTSGNPLYNGNIAASSVNLTIPLSGTPGKPILYVYGYDQLNRLKRQDAYNGLDSVANVWNPIAINPNANGKGDYHEDVSYDASGNIKTYNRNGFTINGSNAMDALTYGYNTAGGNLVNNKLRFINDAVTTSNYGGVDLQNQGNTLNQAQSADNYQYDAIGNMVTDAQSGITNIDWSVYGKIKTVYKATGNVNYTYDAAGHRVSKTVGGLTTYYVLDAQGNTLALYDNANSTVNWREQHLYGSSRLGMWLPNVDLNSSTISTDVNTAWNTSGNKNYQSTNNVDNVMVTYTNRPLQHSSDGVSIDYFTADIVTSGDYFNGGMNAVGRQFNAGTTPYPFSFNGKRDDKDITLGAQEYGERISDKRTVRFFSVDPLTKSYPWYTPYQISGNNPVNYIDIDGGEPGLSEIEKYKYGNNVASNGIKIIDNFAIDLVNGGISFVNSTIDLAHNITDRPEDIPGNFKDAFAEMSQNAKYNFKALYSYYTKTPAKQQLKDVGTAVKTPETYENTLVLGFSLFAPEISKGLTAESAPLSYSVFEQPHFSRGLDIEALLGGNLPKNFPVIDRFVDGVATSIKSIDLTAKTYQSTSKLLSRVKGYINSVAKFDGASFDGEVIAKGATSKRELNIAIQKGKATATQTKTLNEAQTYGAQKGVKVIITEIQ